LDDKLKVYTVPRLLIIDEIGYLLASPQGEAHGRPRESRRGLGVNLGWRWGNLVSH
jgi:hypothetical protein